MSIGCLAGCGNAAVQTTPSAETGNTETPAAAADAAETPAADAGEVQKLDEDTAATAIDNLIANTDGTVSLTVWASEMDQDFTQGLIDDFKAQYPGVSFDIKLGAESEANAKDDVLKDATAAADVFAFADDQISELVNAKALAPVNVAYTYDVTAENGAGSVAAATVNGTVYAYPMTADNGYFLYYDKSVFSEDDVKSLDKMAEVAAAAGKKVGFELNNAWYLYGFFNAQGTGLHASLNADGVTNDCNWNEAPGPDVAQAILDLVAGGGFEGAANGDAAVENLSNGTYAAIVNGVWSADTLKTNMGDNYAATKLPSFKAGGKDYQMSSFAGYKLIGVNAHSQFIGWSMLLAEYLTNEDSQVKRFEARGLGPANTKAASDPKVLSDAAIAAIAAQSEFATPQRIGGNFWAPAATLGETLAGGNQEGTDVQTLLDNAVEGINAPVSE